MARVLGVHEIQRAFLRISVQADVASRLIVVQSAAIAEAEIKKQFRGSHAKGAPHEGGPQPNVVTGTLRRSVRHSTVQRDAGGWSTTVGPSTVYARRVELGFTGTDSIGRHYTQPAYPYFAPGVAAARPKMLAVARANWAKAITG